MSSYVNVLAVESVSVRTLTSIVFSVLYDLKKYICIVMFIAAVY